VLFLSVFFAAGGYGLYQGVTSFLAGGALASPEVFVPLLAGGIFIVVPGRMLLGILRGDTEEGPASPPADAPWTVRPNWESNEIPEDASAASLRFFAVIWNLITWPMAGVFLYEAVWQAPEPEWGMLFVLLFPAVGLVVGWLAVKQVLQRWKFGASTLVMETMPARLGRRLRARLRTGVPPEETPEEGFHVRLSCYYRYVQVTQDSDGSTDRDVKKDLKWRDEKHMRGQARADETGTEVPIFFEVPADLPPSPPRKTEDRFLWEVDASAELPGLDYDVSFEIPVFEPDDAAPASEPGEEAQPESSEAEGEKVFWGVGDEEGGDGGLQREQEAEPESDPYAQHEIGGDFSEPVSEGIRMDGRPGRGLTFSFAPARAKGAATGLTVLGVGMLGGGVFVFSASVLFGLSMIGFGGLVSYGAWQKWTRASTVTVDDGQIEVTKGAFGKGQPQRFPCAALEDVAVEARGNAGDTTYYTLALTLAESEVEGAKGRGKRVARWVKRLGDKQASGLADRAQEAVEEATRSVRVAGNLTNKQEADWIADRLLKAAEREASFQ